MRKNKNWIELFREESLIRSDVLLNGQDVFDFNSLGVPSKEGMKEIINYLEVDPRNLYYFYSDLCSDFYYIDEENFNYIRLICTTLESMKFINIKEKLDKWMRYSKEYYSNGDYFEMIFSVEKKYQIEAFVRLLDLYKHNKISITRKELFEVFVEIYTYSEFGFNEFDRSDISLLLSLSSDNDYKAKINKDDGGYVTIYRGEGELSSPLNEAYSWTLDKDKAEWFANRFDTENIGIVYQARVHIDNIKAYFEDRGEEEVIVFPEDIADVQIILNKS